MPQLIAESYVNTVHGLKGTALDLADYRFEAGTCQNP